MIISDCPGNEIFYGNDGDDYIRLGLGHDIAYGGDGNDTIEDAHSAPRDCEALPTTGYVPDPDRRCYQSLPNFWIISDDLLDAGPGEDTVLGGLANDAIIGAEGNDRLLGGPGQDTIEGGADFDICDGGEGDADLNGNFFQRPLTDCEQSSNIEYKGAPWPDLTPDPLNCSRGTYPESSSLAECMRLRPRLGELNWGPDPTSDSESGHVLVQLRLIPGEEDISAFRIAVTPDFGDVAEYAVKATCRNAPDRDGLIPCDMNLSPSRQEERTTWCLRELTIEDAGGHWSQYLKADLDDAALTAPDPPPGRPCTVVPASG